MVILRIIGILLIIAWLVLWLAVKITFAAIHALLILGVIVLIASLFGRSRSPTVPFAGGRG